MWCQSLLFLFQNKVPSPTTFHTSMEQACQAYCSLLLGYPPSPTSKSGYKSKRLVYCFSLSAAQKEKVPIIPANTSPCPPHLLVQPFSKHSITAMEVEKDTSDEVRGSCNGFHGGDMIRMWNLITPPPPSNYLNSILQCQLLADGVYSLHLIIPPSVLIKGCVFLEL